MIGSEIIRKVKNLGLPKGSYIVFGSCPLAIAGIREANDIDMLVSKKIFGELRKAGWSKVDKGHTDKPIVWEVFEAHYHWLFSDYSPSLEHLLETATIVEGVPFASLQEVRKWKAASGNPKHQTDIKLIDNYLSDIV